MFVLCPQANRLRKKNSAACFPLCNLPQRGRTKGRKPVLLQGAERLFIGQIGLHPARNAADALNGPFIRHRVAILPFVTRSPVCHPVSRPRCYRVPSTRLSRLCKKLQTTCKNVWGFSFWGKCPAFSMMVTRERRMWDENICACASGVS